MTAIIESIKQVWGLLTQLGIAQAISAAVVSSALTVWSYIEGEKTSVLTVIAIATFCFVFVFYNSARFVYCEYKNYPDYDAWDKVSALTVWQVACLWANQKPYNKLTPDTKAYPYLQMLKIDLESGLFETIPDGGEEILWRKISRDVLLKYASQKGEKPLFLFPDQR